MSDLNKTVLVTGASGFIGLRLCKRLKGEGQTVVALGRTAMEGPWDRFVQCDLSSEEIPEEALKEVVTVFHLASKAHSFTTRSSEDRYNDIIVDGTSRLVEASMAVGVKTFIHLSSVKAMGEGNPSGLPLSPMDESWPHTPQSAYGLAKFRSESMVLERGFAHAVVLRPAMVYGPGGKGNLPRMREAIRRKRFPPIPENDNKRSMIHVDDLIEFILRAAGEKSVAGKTYILCEDEPVSTRQLYDAVRASLGKDPVSWSVPFWCLKTSSVCGSILGTIIGRRMPLDRETLGKLTDSSWYSAASAKRDLGYTAGHSVLHWIGSHPDD